MAVFAAIVIAVVGASYVMTKQAMKKAKAQADAMAGVLVNKESNIEPIPVFMGIAELAAFECLYRLKISLVETKTNFYT